MATVPFGILGLRLLVLLGVAQVLHGRHVGNAADKAVGKIQEPLYKLDIVHFNDFHARFEETTVEAPICKTQDSKCIGGFARLYTKVMELMSLKPEAVLLDAGDSFQGTIWYNFLGWNVTQYFINMLPIDAHALGNHEFDSGVKGLVPYLLHLKSPVLAANLDTRLEPTLDGLYKNHTIVERKGRKIGIIGLIISRTKFMSTTEDVIFLEERQAAQEESDLLKAQGVDIILLLSHCGLDIDIEIAQDYGKNIDVIIGGHSHSLLHNGPAPSNETVVDMYPVVNKQNPNHTVIIVQASAFSKYLGDISVFFDEQGEIVRWEGDTIFLDNSIPQDERILAELEPYMKQVHAESDKVIGETLVPLPFRDCAERECLLGNIMCDALLEWVAELNVTEVSDASSAVCIYNRGGLRNPIEAGPISLASTLMAAPYANAANIISLKGRYLLEAFEHAVSYHSISHEYAFMLQVGGLKVEFNMSHPVGSRVLSLEARQKDEKNATTYSKVDPEKEYTIVTVRFVATGGDDYTMISENRRALYEDGTTEFNILSNYIERHSPLSPEFEGRIVMIT